MLELALIAVTLAADCSTDAHCELATRFQEAAGFPAGSYYGDWRVLDAQEREHQVYYGGQE